MKMTYAGSHELVRLFGLQQAQACRLAEGNEALFDQCMADYDEDGWKRPAIPTDRDVSCWTKSIR